MVEWSQPHSTFEKVQFITIHHPPIAWFADIQPEQEGGALLSVSMRKLPTSRAGDPLIGLLVLDGQY